MRHAVAVLLLSLSGCYTLARGRQDVEVTSDPPGAHVRFGRVEGVTPCVFEMVRSDKPKMIRFELEGREPVQQEITTTQDDGSWQVLLAVVDGLLILPGIVDLIAWDPFFDWPTSIKATLAVEGRPSSIWVDREEEMPATATVPRRRS